MNPKKLSVQLIRLSMIAYILWLMLPAAQAAGRAMTGAACVGLFGLGVLMDFDTLRKQWLPLLLRALCTALLPLLIRLVMDRGGNAAAGFYVRCAMLCFPVVFVGHVRGLQNKELWKHTQWVLLGAVVLTLVTTCGWLIEGLIRDSGTAIYSRILGNAEPGQEAYLKTLMLRNIGGYDFIYAMVAALPLTCIAIADSRGGRRWAFIGLVFLQVLVIFLSQYTYALLYAALILGVEMVALAIRKLSRDRVKAGASMLYALIPFILAALLAQPLLSFAAALLKRLGFFNLSVNLGYLQQFLQGGAVAPDTRMAYYPIALQGFVQSPIIGSLAGGEKLFSYHSDLLDLLSGAGLIGLLGMGLMLWLMGRGSLRGLRSHRHRTHLLVMFVSVIVIAALGTVVYSREILLVAMLGTLFVLEN